MSVPYFYLFYCQQRYLLLTDSFLLILTRVDEWAEGEANEKEEEEPTLEEKDYLDILADILDTSNYPKDHPKYSDKRAAVLGFWKDELASKVMIRYVGLRAKCYSYLVGEIDRRQHVKCKGVRAAAKRSIPFEKFAACLEKVPQKVNVSQVNFRVNNHTIYTLRVKKTAFTSFDDKRWIYNCSVHSSPYGSSLITPDGVCPFCQCQ